MEEKITAGDIIQAVHVHSINTSTLTATSSSPNFKSASLLTKL